MTTKFIDISLLIKNRKTLPFIFIVAISLLSGCSKQAQVAKDMETYGKRLGNVLEVTQLPSSESFLQLNFPAKTAYILPSEEQQFTLRDFYELPHCLTVKSLIAEKNSSLGRVQDASMQFLYHWQLTSMLNDCLTLQSDVAPDSLRSNDSFSNKAPRNPIENLLDLKNKDLNVSWHSLLTNSEELRKAMSSQGILLTHDLVSAGQPIADFSQIHIIHEQILAKSPISSHNNLIATLKSIEDFKLPSRLWNTLFFYQTQLKALNQLLLEHAVTLPCENPKAKKQAEYLNNVFQLFFIEKLQPFAANLNQLHYQLSPLLHTLYVESSMSKVHADFIINNTDKLFGEYQLTMKTHIEIWQTIFKQCNIKPGRRD